jgi:carbon storage regulator
MLVLSRKKNERICINDDITITVVEIRGDKVRLGIEAPQTVKVHRQEVADAIRRQTVLVNCPVCNRDGAILNGSACGQCRDGKIGKLEADALLARTAPR